MLQTIGLLTERNQTKMSMLCHAYPTSTPFLIDSCLPSVAIISRIEIEQIKFICHFTNSGRRAIVPSSFMISAKRAGG